MAKERKAMKIEQIRRAENILFWIERAAIFLFVFFAGIPRFLYYSVGLFIFTNFYYASLAYERLFVTPQPKEPPNNLFIFDRYASWLAAIHFFKGSPVYRYVAAAVFIISNMNLIMKFFGVNLSQILNCNPTDCKDKNFLSQLVQWHKRFENLDYPEKDEKEEEIEKPLAVEESAEEKTKLDEIEGIPETENIEPEAHDEMEEGATLVEEEETASNKEGDGEEDFEIVSYKKDDDDVDEDDSDDDDEDDYASSSDGEEDDYDSSSDGEEDDHDSSNDDEDDSSKEETKTQENVEDNEKEVKDQELKEKEDGPCCEMARYYFSSMRRQMDLVREQTQLEGKYCKLKEQMNYVVEKLVLLEQENAVLSRELSSERTSTEQLNRLVHQYERKCQRLEEEKADLNARFSTAKAQSDFYRECMHNLGLNNELSTI